MLRSARHDVRGAEGVEARESEAKHSVHNDFLRLTAATCERAHGEKQPARAPRRAWGGDTTVDDVITLEQVSKRFGPFVAVHCG